MTYITRIIEIDNQPAILLPKDIMVAFGINFGDEYEVYYDKKRDCMVIQLKKQSHD